MALTATATKATRKMICRNLGMRNHEVVSQSPNKSNIKYSVRMKGETVADILAPLGEVIKMKRKTMPRVIIFAKTYEACGDICIYLCNYLGNELTEPIDAPNDLAYFRLVDMFTACTKKELKYHTYPTCSIILYRSFVTHTEYSGLWWQQLLSEWDLIVLIFEESSTGAHLLMLKHICKKQVERVGTVKALMPYSTTAMLILLFLLMVL